MHLCHEHSAKRKSGSEVAHEKRQSVGVKAVGAPWWVQALVHRKQSYLAVRMQTLGERSSRRSVIDMQTWPSCMAKQKMVQLARLGYVPLDHFQSRFGTRWGHLQRSPSQTCNSQARLGACE